MKKFLLLILLIIFTDSYSAEYWLPTGTMSANNTDWVYALNSNRDGQLFASSWAVGIYKGQSATSTTWNFSGLTGKRVSDLFVSPKGDVYGYSHTTSTAYIHRSTDNGATWQDVYVRAFANNYAGGGGMVFPADGSIVAAFAVTVGPTIGDVATYVFKSTDDGNNWTQKTIIYSGFVGGMKLLDDNRIFMGTSLSGVVQSTNNGNNWTSMTTFPPFYIHNILQDKDNVIYVCDAYGPNRSTDNGQTFVDVSTPAPAGLMIEASFVAPNGDFYISYNHDNLYRSTNKGDSWQLLNNGFPATTYVCSFAEANGKIYAGTNNSATFFLRNDVVGVQSGNEIVNEYKLKQNYPNPFNPETRINYELPAANYITIKVYDAIGNEVKTLVSGKQNAGSYSVNFNAASLPSGVYYYKLVTENFSDTKKMILVK